MAATTRDAVISAVLAAASGRPVPTPESLQLPMPSLANTSASSRTSLPPGASESVFSIRVPKHIKRKFNVMRFNHAHGIDFSNWKAAHMEREDNSRQFKPLKSSKEAMPKFGAGSEFGRDKREAARRRKYGMYRKKYKPQDQPWLLKIKENLTKKAAISNKPGQPPAPAPTGQQIQQRKFRGTIEGGFKDNSSYYIFEQKAGGIIEAYPVHQWLNFTPIQTYKALSAEEAEEEFGRRNKNLNLFTLMAKKRWKLQNDDGEDEESKGEGGGGKGKRKDKSFRVSEMDDWDDDDEDDDGDSDEGGDDDDKKGKKGKGKGNQATKKKKKGGSDDEPLEESDDGDEEGLELDYISDSSEPSEDEDEKKPELAGVDQEKTGLLESDSSDEENAEKKKAGRNAEREAEKKAKKDEQTSAEDKSKKLKEKHKKKDKFKKKLMQEADGEGGEGGGYNMPDLNNDERKTDVPGPSSGGADGVDAAGADKARGEGGLKRKATGDLDSEAGSKRSKLVEVDPALLQQAASEGITEEAVRKYLLRKPMTVAELLQKFKQKQHKISNEDMVPIIAHLLKKINPSKSKSQTSKLYFFLKPK